MALSLSINQQLVLDAIDNDAGVSVDEIADETGLSEGRVRQALTTLTGRGLVMSLGPPDDLRLITIGPPS